MRCFRFSVLLVLLGVLVFNKAVAQANFDYYLLSLSWSPEYCALRPEDRQCGRGYGFVLHGLWPQYQRGYPQFCRQEAGGMTSELKQNYQDLYPNRRLIDHEWEKHGACSGLSPDDYLALSHQLKARFNTPDSLNNLTQPLRLNAKEFKNTIIKANPWLRAEHILIDCSDGGRFLQEVRICIKKDGSASQKCADDQQKRAQKSCGQTSFLIRNIR